MDRLRSESGFISVSCAWMVTTAGRLVEPPEASACSAFSARGITPTHRCANPRLFHPLIRSCPSTLFCSNAPRDSDCLSKPAAILFLTVALVVAIITMAFLGGSSRRQNKLQKYLAELKARGEKLTFAEIVRQPRTNFFDSHAVITNTAARLNALQSSSRLNPGMLEPRAYARPGQARPTWAEPDVPRNGNTWEELVAQMQAAESPLQEVRDALKHPAPDAGPFTNMFAGRRVNFVAIRTAAQWLMGAAENELHQGHLEAALVNLEALAALAQMERDEPTLVAQMIRVAVAGLGLATTWDALQVPGWTDAQLQRLLEAWTPVDLVQAVETGFVGERAGGYELFTGLRQSKNPQAGRTFRSTWTLGSATPKATLETVLTDYVWFPAYKMFCMNEDEILYLTTMQETISGLRLLEARRPWQETYNARSNALARISSLANRPDKYRYYISLIAIPNFVRAGDRAVQTETERQLTLAAIGLKRYQLRQGHPPANLSVLVPNFLPTLPYDPMSGQSLGYHLKPEGSFLLYSVGEDGLDQGGDPTPKTGTKPGLWDGRDAVWPALVEH
jgi:hypothetical protein